MGDSTNLQTLTAVDFHGKKFEVAASDLKWRPSAYAVVLHEGSILLTRQVGTYNLPGGGIDFGEMPEATVVRETIEETGIRVANPRLISCKSNIFKNLRTDDVVELFQSILLFYACDYVGGEFSLDGIDERERAWSEMPEWVPLSRFGDVKLGSSYEWRDIVEREAATMRY